MQQDLYQFDFVRVVRLEILFAEQELKKFKYLLGVV